MRERSIRQEVAIKTMAEDGQEYGATRQDVLKQLKCKFGLSETDAQKMLELYWQKKVSEDESEAVLCWK